MSRSSTVKTIYNQSIPIDTLSVLTYLPKLPENTFQFTYVWTDRHGGLRCKSRTIYDLHRLETIEIEDVPRWNYDGSSTGETSTDDSDVYIVPRALFRDPFKQNQENCYIVICDKFGSDNTPMDTNYRFPAMKIFNERTHLEPMFGLEQEFFFETIDKTKRVPLSNHDNNYCSVISSKDPTPGTVLQLFYHYALVAGIKVSGINNEVATMQFEFQIGPCIGVSAGDHLYAARYVLATIAAMFGYQVNYRAKPGVTFNGSGMHTNFSTNEMRLVTTDGSSYNAIEQAIKNIGDNHSDLVEVCGLDTDRRLTGDHETSSIHEFTYGVADRTASIRIPRDVHRQGYGYLEYRCPSSSADPYRVTSQLLLAAIPDTV